MGVLLVRSVRAAALRCLFVLALVGLNPGYAMSQDSLIVDETGKVGIGTSTPAATLHIQGAALPIIFHRAGGAGAGVLSIDNRMAGSAADMVYYPVPDGGGPGGHAFYSIQNNHTLFALGIDREGKIGIGTISPMAKLHVNGSVRGNQSGALRIDTGYGYVDVGPKEAGAAHFSTNRAKYQFDKPVQSDTGVFSSGNADLTLQTAGTRRITVLRASGMVGIGTSAPHEMLHVEGNIKANKVFVSDAGGGGADYVFEENYPLPSLEAVAQYIKANKHLPGIPSAAEMNAGGIDLSSLLIGQLKKIEELTLYLVDLKQENEALKRRMATMEAQLVSDRHHAALKALAD
jgi:hypothetical protein